MPFGFSLIFPLYYPHSCYFHVFFLFPLGLSVFLDISAGFLILLVFRFWMNSLGVPVRNFTDDMKDGLVLIKVFNAIAPGLVDWTKVNVKQLNAYKMIENCEYVVKLAKQLNFSTVAIGGRDINEGNKKLVLGT